MQGWPSAGSRTWSMTMGKATCDFAILGSEKLTSLLPKSIRGLLDSGSDPNVRLTDQTALCVRADPACAEDAKQHRSRAPLGGAPEAVNELDAGRGTRDDKSSPPLRYQTCDRPILSEWAGLRII